ncbi:hypothetical protein EV426DRAFT_251183 [Tirmania nivea]|nr:hypothetical protein EV426DRAFT_251183 [Tirmania nivea]
MPSRRRKGRGKGKGTGNKSKETQEGASGGDTDPNAPNSRNLPVVLKPLEPSSSRTRTENPLPEVRSVKQAVSGEATESPPMLPKPTAVPVPKKLRSASTSGDPPEGRSEYQHFVPRLVLREFATAEARVAATDRRNPSISVYSLADGSITPSPVARCYGYTNMYQDVGASLTDEMHIEKALSVLEGQASRIITRIKRAQARNAPSVTLTRTERNCVRKFLFVMKIRTPYFWTKYSCTKEEYQHIDREYLLEFMQERNFTRPIEVWLHTLKTIMDTPIDANGKWGKTVTDTCFFHDADWFIQHMNGSFMAFCQPADMDDEFIISDTAFGIHEGPTEVSTRFIPQGAITSREAGRPYFRSKLNKSGTSNGWYTEYHHLAPFSPKLLLVLRSNDLRTEETKRNLREIANSGLPGAHRWAIPSVFEHLHLEPPEPSYGRNITFEQFKPSDQDTFTFPLHKLSNRDLVLFNSIILNEVRRNLTWNSDLAMKRTLEAYLKEELFLLPMSPLLFFAGEDLDVTRREKLHKLLELLKGSLGEEAERSAPSITSHIKGMHGFEKNLQNIAQQKGYFKLGGRAGNWTRDFFQSNLVSKMRNKIADALPPGDHRLTYRQAVLRNELEFFATLPPIVIYLHVGMWRMVQKKRQSRPGVTAEQIFKQVMSEEEDGAENAVANLVPHIPRQHLSKLMLHASLRRVNQQESLITGIDNTELSIFSHFGGITSSFLLESTPWYDPRIGRALRSPYQDVPVQQEVFLRELYVRWQVKQQDFIKLRWGPIVNDFVWEWLYEAPGVDD